jgi:hypothetical protein
VPTKKKAKASIEPSSENPKLKMIPKGTHYQGMQRFIIKRSEDVSGTSGIGIVAEGVKFSNGWVAVTWLSAYQMVTVSPNIDTIVGVHGHGGKTWVEYEDVQPKEH